MVYELIEHDELPLMECIYEVIRECLISNEPIRLKLLAKHCGVTVHDLEDRIQVIHIIELRTRLELDLPYEE